KSGGFRRDSILADALEAVLGAVLLDGGFEAVKDYILSLWRSRLEDLPSAESLKDPKTRLQEYLQSRGFPLPNYEVVKVSGQPHEQTFEVICRIESLQIQSQGVAGSRRRAEQAAADLALESIHER
ncbi:MAG: putative dsRNA-binding protein, partial [Pseudomonadota bacterium]